jgi:hypothetical protein
MTAWDDALFVGSSHSLSSACISSEKSVRSPRGDYGEAGFFNAGLFEENCLLLSAGREKIAEKDCPYSNEL